jgi:hypothetical protein
MLLLLLVEGKGMQTTRALNGKTPAEKAQIATFEQGKWLSLIKKSANNQI